MLNLTTISRGPQKKENNTSTFINFAICPYTTSFSKFSKIHIIFRHAGIFEKKILKIFLVKENEAYLWNIWECYTSQN
jgi:hypothetical protein